MVSQNAIRSKQHLGGTRPYVFTEHGVLLVANGKTRKQARKKTDWLQNQ